jgi:glycosyltransferase involved in cell wall biosynthesis
MIIIDALEVTGPAKGIFQFIDNVKHEDVTFIIYNFEFNKKRGELFEKEATRLGASLRFLKQRGRNYFSLLTQTTAEVKKQNINIVQTHGFKPTFLGFFVRFICKVRWVCFMHGTTNENLKVRMYNLVDNILQLFSHRTVLVSEAQRQKVLGGNDKRRAHVLHNAVDIDCPMQKSEQPPPIREMYSIPIESKIVVAVGRFSPEKGMDVLIEAFQLLLRQVEGTHLILVGDGQERKAIEAQVQNLGLSDKVHFTGYTKTPGDYVAEADVVALPSRSEGIPNTVLEAMAIGLPVVATAVGGVPEIIQDGLNGRLVPPSQPALLANALAEVLSKPELHRRLSLAGRQRVSDAFSIEARVRKLLALYQDVLDERR